MFFKLTRNVIGNELKGQALFRPNFTVGPPDLTQGTAMLLHTLETVRKSNRNNSVLNFTIFTFINLPVICFGQAIFMR